VSIGVPVSGWCVTCRTHWPSCSRWRARRRCTRGDEQAFRDERARQILAGVTAVRRGDGAAEVLTLLAVRGYLGYVDAVIVHRLALPEDQRDQVSVDMIADMAAGAFSAGFPALA
jgi:hypothetical protein